MSPPVIMILGVIMVLPLWNNGRVPSEYHLKRV